MANNIIFSSRVPFWYEKILVHAKGIDQLLCTVKKVMVYFSPGRLDSRDNQIRSVHCAIHLNSLNFFVFVLQAFYSHVFAYFSLWENYNHLDSQTKKPTETQVIILVVRVT